MGTSVLLVAAVATVSVAGATAATSTKTSIYTPFTSTGAVPAHIGKTVHGSCFTGSDAVAHKGAWRCMSANILYDPCFSPAHAAGLVLCPASGPWSSSLIEIKLTKPLPTKFANTGKPSTKGLPWALETTAGWKCELATGATTSVSGKRLNYFCGASTKNALWGSPIRTAQPWTIFAAPENAKRLTNRVDISSAWF